MNESELKQIMPADGWYLKTDTINPGKTTYIKLMAMGLFESMNDRNYTYVDGIIPLMPACPATNEGSDIVYLPKETREEWTEEQTQEKD